MFASVRPTAAERAAPVVGDDVVPVADVTMDRAFSLAATPEQVWPWVLQLGKRRAGWYFPRRVERFIPPGRRGLRRVDPQWQQLTVGDVIPDYGPDGSFTVAVLQPPRSLVYTSDRGRARMSWAFSLAAETGGTRVHVRLRIAPVRHTWVAGTFGGFFDLVTVAGMVAGLRERVR